MDAIGSLYATEDNFLEVMDTIKTKYIALDHERMTSQD